MKHMLLDRQGSAPVRDGYSLVTSEVDFLRLASDHSNLQVRGTICDWAESFCQARKLSYVEITSPNTELLSICSRLTEEQVERILAEIGRSKFESLERPITVRSVLNAIAPGNRWHSDPSIRHAAEWLLWLIDFRPQSHLRPLLGEMCELWIGSYSDPEKVAYSATDENSALAVLYGWLGIESQPEYMKLGDFPFGVPALIKSKARELWNKQIIESNGTCLDRAALWPKHNALKHLLAEEAYKYFKKSNRHLTRERFDYIAAFLDWHEQKELQVFVPPSVPSEMPTSPQGVLGWFLNEYLPYRRWQLGAAHEDTRKTLNERAKAFGLWYLENYPKALSGGDMRRHLNFYKTAQTAKASRQFITLIVVLDGLHVGDAHSLLLKIQEIAPRLSLQSDDLAFTALPTVTEFCKEALFRGVPPAHIGHVEPIGVIIPENEVPITRLTNARLGEVFLWRIQEPDHTYHSRNKHDALLRKVEAELNSAAKTIQDIVEQVPAEIPLQVLITTDHGRLVGASARTVAIPEGMESHGRAAWGKTDIEFSSAGYLVQGETVFLNAERFGMIHDVAMPFCDDTFLTSDGRTGQEAFPHGGLYPEEVIVPWIAFVRDRVTPNVGVKLSGRADAGKPGTLVIAVINLSDVDVSLAAIDWSLDDRREQRTDIDFAVDRQSAEELRLTIKKWPTNAELRKSQCICRIRQPNGLTFAVEAAIEIQSNEMYRSDNILEDLL